MLDQFSEDLCDRRCIHRVMVAQPANQSVLLQLFRDPIYYGRLPEMTAVLYSMGAASISLLAGWLVFSRMSNRFYPYF